MSRLKQRNWSMKSKTRMHDISDHQVGLRSLRPRVWYSKTTVDNGIWYGRSPRYILRMTHCGLWYRRPISMIYGIIVCDGLWWSSMVNDGKWRTLVVYGCLWWPMNVYHGLSWSVMVCVNLWWSLIQQITTVDYGLWYIRRWSPMVWCGDTS